MFFAAPQDVQLSVVFSVNGYDIRMSVCFLCWQVGDF